MRTFEFSDGKSNKFWNIELSGTSFTVTYGRIGTAGQTQTKEFPSADKAKIAHDKLVAEKVGKGYVEKTAGPAGTAAAAPASGKALENAIFANPDDLGAHAAYADWLIEQGDPRGEFIQVQLALEDPKKPAKERKELQKREKALLEKHEREWLGDLAPHLLDQPEPGDWQKERGAVVKHGFARGWLDSVQFPDLRVAASRALAKLPKARLLSRLSIIETAYEEGEFEEGDDLPEGEEFPSLYPLLKSNNIVNLRVLQLGDAYEDEYFNCHLEGDAAVDLVKKMPRIEELYLLAHNVDLKALFGLKSLQNLRILQVYHVRGTHPFGVLAKNPALEKLTHLLVHPHALEPDDEEAYVTFDGVKALVHSPILKSLTHLRLRLNDMGDRGCTEIVKSGILKRLKMLDIQGGCVSDAGAQILAACPDLKNLELLNISKNRLTEAGVAALTATKIKLTAGDQFKPLPEGQEDQEREYLWDGDIE